MKNSIYVDCPEKEITNYISDTLLFVNILIKKQSMSLMNF